MANAFTTFKSAFVSLHPELKAAEWDYLVQHCQILQAPAKSLLIEANKRQKHLFFLTSGLVRGFYLDEKGEEITVRFVHETGWVTHYSALIADTAARYNFQTLAQSEVVVLPYATVQEGYAQFKGLEKFGRLIAESVLQTQQKRIEDFQFLTAEERYLDFVAQHPGLFNRISISHLSSYLGIKRQSLTRIRKKLSS